MALPGLLIEYLMNGVLALPWLSALLPRLHTNLPLGSVTPGELPVAAVGLYFVGMVVDDGSALLGAP